jgi:acetylornithine/N-succinyldiaminopimelate aminotransferase
LRNGLEAIAQSYSHLVQEVRGWGLINGMELKADIELTSSDIVKAAMDQGLLLVPAGPKVVRFVPPLIVSAAEIEQAVRIVEGVLAQV